MGTCLFHRILRAPQSAVVPSDPFDFPGRRFDSTRNDVYDRVEMDRKVE